ncbi:MAG: hypothetical protein NTY73_03960 [Candidatus Micrarchaeota archaeon]|nr:hypothetical protein [Candidatus Micrarchaeota archaeon]
MRKEALFMLLLAMVAFVSADVQITSYSVLPSTLKPGVTGSVSITVSNPSATTLAGVVIYQGGEQFTFTSNRVQLGDLGALGSTVITIPFTIKGDISPGIYNLRLDAFWTEGSSSFTKSFSVPINVTNPPIFHFSFVPLNQITPGQSFTVNGQITNDGGSVSKIVITVNSESFFLDGVSQLSLGDLTSGSNASFTIPIVASASVSSGVQSIPLTVAYQDPQGALQQTTININPVQVAKSSVDFLLDAQPDKKPLSPGDKTRLSVNITNNGNSKAYSAKVTVSSTSQYFTSLGSSERYFDGISPGSGEHMEFEIGVSGSTPAGYYPLILTINYLNVNGETQTAIQKQVGVEVGSTPEITITPNTNPSPVSSGNKYSLSMQFSNTGSINVRALEVMLTSDSFEILDPPKSYIGSLNIDDYTSVQYTIYSKKDLKPGTYPLHVSMRCKDAYNTEYNMTRDVMLEVVSPDTAALTQAPGGMSLISIILVLIVVGTVGYFVYKRYLKKKAK